MQIRIGYDIAFAHPAPTPMILMLHVHPSRADDLLVPDRMRVTPALPLHVYADRFGNTCTRLVAPQGTIRFAADAVVFDEGTPDPVVPGAIQHEIAELPHEVLVYLLGSRYCETDRLMNVAWSLFSGTPKGWARVQAICDFVNSHISFDYGRASPVRTAYDALEQRAGVCRDFAHLAVAFCRCMNIPARYCTGYLGDIGVPIDPAPMDFSAWFEVYLGGRWYAFDARHNIPRIGRIPMARGRDATDVAISTAFGASTLVNFKVVTDEIEATEKVSAKARTRRWYGAAAAV